MSMTMDESIKRWTAKRKTALVIEIIQGKTTVAEASEGSSGGQVTTRACGKARKSFALNNCHPIDFMMKCGGFPRTDLQGFV